MSGLNPKSTGILLLLLSIFAYMMPWVFGQQSALSLNAYDLAEWLNLHPATQQAAVPLMPGLLLRFQLVWLALMIATFAPRVQWSIHWWVFSIGVVGLVCAQLPPLEFFQSRTDPNQQQQFALTLTSFVGSGMLLMGVLETQRILIRLTITIIALITSVIGCVWSLSLLQAYQIAPSLSWGFGLYSLCLLAMIISTLKMRKSRSQAAPQNI